MEKLETYFIELASLFGYKYDDSFFEHLKSISIPNTTTCGKQIMLGDGGWKCKDCELDTFSIYCNDCFIKEKHIGHDIYFNPSADGFCDCGVNLVLKPEGFCDKHKGEYDNIKDLMDFIKSSINEKLLDNINNIFNKIILEFIDKIKNLTEEKDEEAQEDEEKEKQKQQNEDELYKMIEYIEMFGEKLFKSNLSLFYFFTLKFTENFPYETNHKCFGYDENKNLVKFIKKDKEKKHTCICPFMQVLIYVLMRRKTKQSSQSFINLFLQTYKNKMVTSLCFFNSFSELFYNNNMKLLRELAYQLVNEKVGILVYQDQNIPFLESCYDYIHSVSEYFLEDDYYDEVEEILFRFSQIIRYLPNKAVIYKMNYNIKIINKIIDICCLLNNANIFENKIKYDFFQYEKFNGSFVNAEISCLYTIIGLTHIVNFDNEEIVSSVFNKIFENLNKYKQSKEVLQDKIYTPHLTTIKCYTLFLNRFCYNHSIKNECDLLDSFNYFMNKFPQFKELNEFLFVELINFFGFMISQLHSFFIYFGKNMILYYINYFNTNFNFIKCDISLMKYLMTLPEIKEKFKLSNILAYSDISSSNKFLIDLLNGNFDFNQIETIDNKDEKNLGYNNSVLEFLYLLTRDSLSMEKIAFRDVNFKFKIKDEIYAKFYENEKDIIKSLVKNEIIHFILGQRNLVKRDDCINYISKNFDADHVEIVDEVLKTSCEKIVSANGLIKFSLKKDVLNSCDIDYIISFESRENAIEYMTNFQSKIWDQSNIYIMRPLNIHKKLVKSVYQTFYNEKNLDEMIKLYNLIYANKIKGKLLSQALYSNLTKIFNYAYKLCSTNLLDEDLKIKLLEKMKQIEDKQFQKEKVSEKKDKKSLKEKLKKRFEEKNEILKEKIISSNIDTNEDEDNQKWQETCVICRQALNKNPNNLENLAKIYYYFSDKVTDLLKKIPEDKRIKARKFVSCNHKVHFKCFNESFFFHLNEEFECPLCKKLSNIILYDFSYLIENSYDIVKGLNYTDETIDFDEFYKINEGGILQELFFYNILSFEKYCSILFHKEILIKDFYADKTLLEKTLKLINEDFEEFTMYYSRTDKRDEQIETWKNILFNIRFLFQYKILNIKEFISQSFYNILKVNCVEDFEKMLIKDDFNNIINKYIILSFILFDSNRINRDKIKNIFQNKILLYYIYISFIKSNNNDNIDKFLTNNKSEIKKALDLYCLKYKICLLLFNEKEENININFNLDQIINVIKSNPDFIYLIKSTKKENYFANTKGQYLEVPEFKILDLSENGIEFLNKTNGRPCFYCHKKNLSSYLCLLCGNKICNNIGCFIENGSKKGNEYSLIYHSKKCCGGNGIFLNIKNSEIVYILKRRIITSNIFAYMNDFGEALKNNYLSDEYKLNKVELNKGIMKFIDMTYRRNYQKINFINHDYQLEDNN